MLDQRLDELGEGVVRDKESLRDQLATIVVEVERLGTTRNELLEALDTVKTALRRHEAMLTQHLSKLCADLDALRNRELLDTTALRAELLTRTEDQHRELIARLVADAKEDLAKQLAAFTPGRRKRGGAHAPKEDTLTEIRGIGPALAKKLAAAGVQSPAQVSAWSDIDIERLHRRLGVSLKRLRQWRANAREL